ncbi:MAG: DNA polymerase III subunit delta' C-terminal domain-containing protein [Candidatus Omnitrophota bacterium]
MPSRDIKGQDSALEILKANLASDRIFSGYLFAGADKSAMLLAAKSFAKAVNCLSGKVDACESCVSCRKINSQNHPDVFFVEPRGASSSITIDQIRTVIRQANLKPYEARKKVFIINGAHSMNAEASNAFLKTLEEPPLDTTFILISRSEELLLPTIVSRCYVVKFSPAPLSGSFPGASIEEAFAFKEKSREELKEDLDVLLAFFRDIFLYKATGKEEGLFHKDKIAEIKAQSEKYTSEELDGLIKRIITLRSYVDYNVNPKIIACVLNSEIKRKDTHVRSSTGKAA